MTPSELPIAVICYALDRDYLPQLKDRLDRITFGLLNAGFDGYAHVRDGQNWVLGRTVVADVLEEVFAKIRRSELVVLDLTTLSRSKRTGLCIEAGYAKALGKKIVAIWHEDDRPNMIPDVADIGSAYSQVSEISSLVERVIVDLREQASDDGA